MAHSRGFPRGRARSVRRKTDWDIGPGSSALLELTATGAAFVGSALSLVAGAGPVTVVRTRGELMCYLTTASAINNGFIGAFGIGIASLAAVTAGIASVPTPITESNADNWLYHRFLAFSSVNTFGATIVGEDSINAVSSAIRLEVDSKAMRIVDSDKSLYAAVEFVELGTATVQVAFDSRMLLKLH